MKQRDYKLLPPRGFRAATEVDWVKFSSIPPSFIDTKRKTGRRAEGIRYESRVHQYLKELYGDYYVPSPWFIFGDSQDVRGRWCQPDGLLFFPYTGQITIVECKIQHTSDAWWQTKWLYLPVLRKAFPSDLWKFAIIEIVKWFDPDTLFPETIKMRPSVTEAEPGEFSVHIWKP